jgi:hypothetical protein
MSTEKEKRMTWPLVFGLGCSALYISFNASVGTANPLSDLRLPAANESHFEATVIEQLSTGSYHYLRVQHDAQSQWIVSLNSAQPGDIIDVTVFGVSPRFESRRLNRVFSPLLFVSTTPHPKFSGEVARGRNESP